MQLYQFCFSHQKTLIFVLRTVSLAHLGKKTSFFSLDVPNWLCSAQKSRFFYSRIKTAIIAHKLNSQFSQCTAKPAGLQSKTDRKTKKKPLRSEQVVFLPKENLLFQNSLKERTIWTKKMYWLTDFHTVVKGRFISTKHKHTRKSSVILIVPSVLGLDILPS